MRPSRRDTTFSPLRSFPAMGWDPSGRLASRRSLVVPPSHSTAALPAEVTAPPTQLRASARPTLNGTPGGIL